MVTRGSWIRSHIPCCRSRELDRSPRNRIRRVGTKDGSGDWYPTFTMCILEFHIPSNELRRSEVDSTSPIDCSQLVSCWSILRALKCFSDALPTRQLDSTGLEARLNCCCTKGCKQTHRYALSTSVYEARQGCDCSRKKNCLSHSMQLCERSNEPAAIDSVLFDVIRIFLGFADMKAKRGLGAACNGNTQFLPPVQLTTLRVGVTRFENISITLKTFRQAPGSLFHTIEKSELIV